MSAGVWIAVVVAVLGVAGITICLVAVLKAAGQADDTRFVDRAERVDEGNGHGTPPGP